MTRILLTGFEPFGQQQINSSWEAVKALPEEIDDVSIVKLCLPVSFQKARVVIEQAVEDYCPDVVLSVGQCGGRKEINVERVAVNLVDSKKPDNDGFQPSEQQLYSDAPDAYFSNLPARRLVDAIHDVGIPAVISNSAGLYVCNSVFFTAMHLVHRRYPNMRVGFIHVPYLPCQVVDKDKQHSMSKEIVVQALKAVIHTLATQNLIV